MGVLYLGLSQHMTGPLGETVFGLSVDEHPSERARDAAAKAVAAGDEKGAHDVEFHKPGATIVDLKARTSEGNIEIVIVTFEGTGKPQKDDVEEARMFFTLAPDGLLRVWCTGFRMCLVPLTPLLGRLANDQHLRCQALIVDGSQCRLKRTHQAWCLFHLEQKVLLHDEELEKRKFWHEVVLSSTNMGNDLATNLEGYNIIQESLALRTIITQTIYAGDEDDGHREFVRKTRLNRSNLGQHLVTKNESDGTGRVSISSCYDGFLGMAFARDTCPLDRGGWTKEVVVDLADVRKIRAFQGDGPTPTVYRLFADPSSSVMRERLERKAVRLGNLPNLEPYPPWEKMTHEQRVRDCELNGWPPPPTAEEAAVLHGPKPKEHEQEDEQEDVQEDKQEDEVGEAEREKKDQEDREEVQEDVEEDPEDVEEDQENVKEDQENEERGEHEHEHEHENKQEHKKEVEVEAEVEAEVEDELEDELEDKRQDEEDEMKDGRCEVLEVESEGVL